MTDQRQDCPIVYRDVWLLAEDDVMKDEEYVREYLEDVYFEGAILSAAGDIVHCGWSIADGKTEAEAWANAKEFVDKRKDEIKDVQDEISWLRESIHQAEEFGIDSSVWKRILAREQIVLDKFRKGFN